MSVERREKEKKVTRRSSLGDTYTGTSALFSIIYLWYMRSYVRSFTWCHNQLNFINYNANCTHACYMFFLSFCFRCCWFFYVVFAPLLVCSVWYLAWTLLYSEQVHRVWTEKKEQTKWWSWNFISKFSIYLWASNDVHVIAPDININRLYHTFNNHY